MKNRRKYDSMNTDDIIAVHIKDDAIQFLSIRLRLMRIEIAIWGSAAALAFFIFLIDHPNIIKNLSLEDFRSPAMAREIQ